jgi:large subunit ribosomal protein L32
MAVPKRRLTRSKTLKRRAHDFLDAPTVATCSHCGNSKKPHAVCRHCGDYDGLEYPEGIKVKAIAKA